jgi:ATP-dependent exoDNAse (exonuclease V) beta subunit
MSETFAPLLTDAQREAIETLDTGLCVIAAAGSGKTMVLVERYLRLLQSGLKPDQILTVTFTREAAEQLRVRILKKVASDAPLQDLIRTTPLIGTIHSYCLYLLRTYSAQGFAPREILDDVRWHECFERVFERWFTQLDSDSLREGLGFWNVQDMEAICKEALRGNTSGASLVKSISAAAPAEIWWAKTLPSLVSLWQSEVLSQGIYSFADLENEALSLLSRNQDIRGIIQNSLAAYLIDEFQDTSPIQWKLLENLVGEKWNRVFVVGDPRQSIYGFRNADVRLFFAAQDRITSFGGRTIQLSTCFRSTPAVVKAVNDLTQKLFGGTAFAADQVLSGRDSCKPGPGLETLAYVCGDKQSALLSKAEIQRVSEYLRSRVNAGTSPKSFALLFRNSDRISDYALALENAGLPVHHRKAERPFDYYFAWDLLNFFRSLANPTEDYLVSGFLLSPWVGCTRQQVNKLSFEKKDSLIERALEQMESLQWFGQLLECGQTSPLKALECLLRNTHYWPHRFPGWESIVKLLTEAPTLWDAIHKLEICARNAALGTSEAAPESVPGISLLTIHAAKGLEFDEVLLVDLLRKSSHPNPWMLHSSQGLGFRFREQGEIAATANYTALHAEKLLAEKEEEKRLFYVAITRARDQVTVSLPEDRSLCKPGSWASLF